MKKLYLLILLFFMSCIPPKSLFLGQPDHKDIERLPHRTIQASEDCFTFPPSKNPIARQIKVNDWSSDIPFFIGLNEFIENHKTKSLLIIQNDSILYEYYGMNANPQTLHPSYSIAKSFTSALIGIAIEEGFIQSEQDLVSKYIPELQDGHFKTLTIEHLLNQTSGIKYTLPLDATIYYGNNILNSFKQIEFETPPGTKQHYLNINIQLLGIILHRTTSVYPSKYLEEKIWKPLQMCSEASWTIDKKNELEKTFCCMGATALDYAKFGRLYLNAGKWNDQQIISEDWYQKSIRRDTTNASSFNYNYCWHIGLKEYGDFMAIGMYKQHIYINPQKNLIIVLLNNQEKRLKAERVNWWYIFRQIADQL